MRLAGILLILAGTVTLTAFGAGLAIARSNGCLSFSARIGDCRLFDKPELLAKVNLMLAPGPHLELPIAAIVVGIVLMFAARRKHGNAA